MLDDDNDETVACDDPVADAAVYGVSFTPEQARWLTHHIANAVYVLKLACGGGDIITREQMTRWTLAAVARLGGVLTVVKRAPGRDDEDAAIG